MFKKRRVIGILNGAILATVFWHPSTMQAEEQKTASDAAPKSGKVTGIVTEKTDKYVAVKAEGATEAKRYLVAPEAGGATGIQTALKAVFVPNLVVLEWKGQDQPTVTSIHVVVPKARSGVATGTVVGKASAVREVWIDVKPGDKGFTERYWPRFVGGPDGFDKSMVRTMGEVNVGDRVKLGWTYDERKRAAQIQVVAKAKPANAESKVKAGPAP